MTLNDTRFCRGSQDGLCTIFSGIPQDPSVAEGMTDIEKYQVPYTYSPSSANPSSRRVASRRVASLLLSLTYTQSVHQFQIAYTH